MNSARHVIAIDLGGTKLAAAIFNANGKILHQTVRLLQRRRGKAVGQLIQQQISDYLRFAAKNKISIKAIGVAVPGIAHHDIKTVWAPNIPGWKNYPLHHEISVLVRRRSIKVVIESDRACYILGERWLGAAKNCDNAIFLAVGTGIGAGILIDGKILHGAHGSAGAIGWMALRQPWLSKYKQCGCFEHHASGSGLAKIKRNIFTAYHSGNPVAKKTIRQAIQFWGMAVANLVSLFNPEKIIFGGGIFGPAVQFLGDIQTEAEKWAQPIAITQVKLEPSALGNNAGLYGAGYLALQ